MNDFPFLVANAKREKDRLTVTAPWDQSKICDVPVADSDAVEVALKNAHKIFMDRDYWLSPYKRIEILDKAAEIEDLSPPFLYPGILILLNPSRSVSIDRNAF